tara:strand:- start:268 stop:513 length:246 start_codon:yes stop_codon:yes gene_type:complete
MSCKSLRKDILNALIADSEGKIQKARINTEVYLHNPVGIGEHPDVLASIQNQLDVIAHEEERIQVLTKYFVDHIHAEAVST